MKAIILGIALSTLSTLAIADLAVVVHPSNSTTEDSSSLSRLFLGKSKSFAGGGEAIPVNQEEGMGITDEFNQKVLNKSASQLKAYWSKLVFTGKGTPPKSVGSDAEVISLVGKNPSLIGYVDAAAVDDSVKVIATF